MPEALYAPLQDQVRELEDVLRRSGFVRCDLAACNCGSWHHRFGLPQRMDEIKDALSEAGHPLSNENGNLVLNALKALIAERDSLADATCSLRGGQIPDGWKLVPVDPTYAMGKAAADAWLDCGSRLVLNKAAAAVRAGIAAAPSTHPQEQP